MVRKDGCCCVCGRGPGSAASTAAALGDDAIAHPVRWAAAPAAPERPAPALG